MLCLVSLNYSIFVLEATIPLKKYHVQSLWSRFSAAHCSSQHLRMSVDASSTHVVLIGAARGYQYFSKTTRYIQWT